MCPEGRHFLTKYFNNDALLVSNEKVEKRSNFVLKEHENLLSEISENL